MHDRGRLPAPTRDSNPPRSRRFCARACPGTWEIDWILSEYVGGTASPLDTPLWRTLERWVESIEPGARLAPIVSAGFTDSHYIRKAFDTTVYGFFPLKAMDTQLAARLVHSADERIAVDDLELGVDLFRHVALHRASREEG